MEIPKKTVGQAYVWTSPRGTITDMGTFLGYTASGTLRWSNGETTADDIRFSPKEDKKPDRPKWPWGKS